MSVREAYFQYAVTQLYLPHIPTNVQYCLPIFIFYIGINGFITPANHSRLLDAAQSLGLPSAKGRAFLFTHNFSTPISVLHLAIFQIIPKVFLQ